MLFASNFILRLNHPDFVLFHAFHGKFIERKTMRATLKKQTMGFKANNFEALVAKTKPVKRRRIADRILQRAEFSKNYQSISFPELQVPENTYFFIQSLDDINTESIAQSLKNEGFVIIKLDFVDTNGFALEGIINKIGKPNTHDQMGRTLWDVKVGGSNGEETKARSHTLSEFPMHTDSSYEEDVPDYIGLYTVREDKKGGGINLFIDGKEIVNNLPVTHLNHLKKPNFKINVPKEFYKNTPYIVAPIIDNNYQFRYRNEIIDTKSCIPDEISAINFFQKMIDDGKLTKKFFLHRGEILLLDNKRFLHARTDIFDKKRHLKRVRFNLS